MDIQALRTSVAGHIGTFANNTHRELDAAFERLELQARPDGSRRERVENCLANLVDEDLQSIAERILREPDLAPRTRFEIEEALWEGAPGVPTINRRTRHPFGRSDVLELYLDAEDSWVCSIAGGCSTMPTLLR